MEISRRTMLAGAGALAAFAGPAHADPQLEAALDRLETYFRSAAVLAGAVTFNIALITPAKVKRAERPKVKTQIDEFYAALTELAVAQRTMLGSMGDYIDSVRARGFNETEHPRLWRALVQDMRDISAKVSTVYAAQQKATWMKAALSAEDEQALGDVLLARVSLLDQLTQLPPPRTPIEIDKLAALHGRYQELSRKLYDLRTALAEAKRRFS